MNAMTILKDKKSKVPILGVGTFLMDDEGSGVEFVRAWQIYISNVFTNVPDLCASAHTRRDLAFILTDKSKTKTKPGLSAAHFRILPSWLNIVLLRLFRRLKDDDFQFDVRKFEKTDELEK